MNLAALRLWMTVAEMGSFSRAADSLFISQPAVSKRVQELEESLGVSLLDRSGRMVRLTEAGQILYRYSQQIFAAERAAESALFQLRDLRQGHLSVGASSLGAKTPNLIKIENPFSCIGKGLSKRNLGSRHI